MTATQVRSIWRAVRTQQTRVARQYGVGWWGTWREYRRCVGASRRARVKCVRLMAEAFGVPVARTCA
jgi:hypothetical protein